MILDPISHPSRQGEDNSVGSGGGDGSRTNRLRPGHRQIVWPSTLGGFVTGFFTERYHDYPLVERRLGHGANRPSPGPRQGCDAPQTDPSRYNRPMKADRAHTLSSLILGIVVTLLALTPSGSEAGEPGRDVSALEPARSGGLAALDRALVRLSTHRRLLVIAAHPDDEDTSLLTWVARGLGGEAAYLSLSRGDGGQNLIGPELGVGLGVLRSRELLAAREIDGARQFFSRAYDFGYTRSLDETLRRWPEEVLLEDAARVVRRFKPQVLVAIFPATERAGHGQHWASAVVADQLVDAAGRAGAFPGLEADGLLPWDISTFYRAAWWNPEATTLELPLGTLEPWSGRSILQIALHSRSQHRCQDMGNLQPLGGANGRLTWQSGAGGPDGDLFGGIDTSLAAIAQLLPDGPTRATVATALAEVERLALGARSQLDARQPQATTTPLLAIVGKLRSARQAVGDAPEGSAQHVAALIDEKLDIAQEALAVAAQVLADAYTESETVVLGSQLETRSVFWNAGPLEVTGLEVEIVGEEGWNLVGSAPSEPDSSRFATEVTDERTLTVAVAAEARPTVPYFLDRPLDGDLYDWNDVPPDVRGEPFQPPPLRTRFVFELAGVPVALEREVIFRQRDQAFGEVRRPLRAVPALEITAEPAMVVWPLAAEGTPRLHLAIASNLGAAVRGRVEIDAPAGWPTPAPQPFSIAEPGGRTVLEIPLVPPTNLAPGRYAFDVAAIDSEGRRYDHAYPLVDYEHIRPTALPRPARVSLAALDLKLPALERVGYVRGASDRVPEYLAAVGVPIELLDGEALATGNLSRYDAIVIGSRAYETVPALVRANPRLLDYTHGGGLLIVQYQQYQFARGGYAPHPLDIHRPHDRVTDETAPVRLLVPDHPVFHSPNELNEADWQGWVQERGLYFAGTWDDAYTPLLAMADPGGEEHQGALLVAPQGQGTYVYTGLAFFRQLPAGVPGAYRLLVNLLGL